MYYKVTFKHSENVFCTNIAIADNVEAVKDHYSKYSWVNVRECAEWEVEEGKTKGMPIVTIEAEKEPEKVAAVVEKTVHGYTVEQYIIGAFDTPIALIDRHLDFCSWVVAWNYDMKSDTWGQGHYFDDKAAAVAYFKTYMD